MLVTTALRIATLLLAAGAPAAAASAKRAAPADAPRRLSETGLYASGRVGEVRAEALPFAPQYPLWTDGATKRRWMLLPPGTAIDARRPEAWVFPVGTRFWKEFSVRGRPVETRTLERTKAGWRFATYVWNEAGTEAHLAPERGLPGPVEVGPGVRHAIPSQTDCRACHEGDVTPVLGASLLQLSPDRDPRAPHAEPPPAGGMDLRALVAKGLVRGLPRAALDRPPRIDARSPVERAALGYLHANCGGCHNGRGPLAPLGLRFDQPATGDPARVLLSTVAQPSQFRPPGGDARLRVAPGAPALSTLVYRMRSRSPLAQMPPLGTALVDEEGARLIEAWIAGMERKEDGR